MTKQGFNIEDLRDFYITCVKRHPGILDVPGSARMIIDEYTYNELALEHTSLMSYGPIGPGKFNYIDRTPIEVHSILHDPSLTPVVDENVKEGDTVTVKRLVCLELGNIRFRTYLYHEYTTRSVIHAPGFLVGFDGSFTTYAPEVRP